MTHYEIESSVLVKYFEEIIEVVEAHGWVFVVSFERKRKVALMPYSFYWNTIDDGK